MDHTGPLLLDEIGRALYLSYTEKKDYDKIRKGGGAILTMPGAL